MDERPVIMEQNDPSGTDLLAAERFDAGEPRGPSDGSAAALNQILDELRALRRERRHTDFSIGTLAGAIVQAFAVCAIGWGLFAAVSGDTYAATVRLLAGIAFQLVALTWFLVASRR